MLDEIDIGSSSVYLSGIINEKVKNHGKTRGTLICLGTYILIVYSCSVLTSAVK
jgi:hypothetical protein